MVFFRKEVALWFRADQGIPSHPYSSTSSPAGWVIRPGELLPFSSSVFRRYHE